MKATIFALTHFLLSSLITAAPIEKRDPIIVTEVVEVYETVYTTTTIWVHPNDVHPEPTTTAAGQFYEVSSSQSAAPETTTSEAPVYVAPTPSPAPTPSSSEAPVYVAPVPSSSSSVYVAPPQPTTTEVPTPVYTPPVVETTPEPVAEYSPPPPPVSSTPPAPVEETPSYSDSAQSSGAPSGASVHTAEMTYYDTGSGSCGGVSSPDEDVVAIAFGIMQNGANPNNNPLCGKTVTLEYEGRTHTAKVVDTCMGCVDAAIDCSTSLFKKVAPNGDGRVKGVKWWFNN